MMLTQEVTKTELRLATSDIDVKGAQRLRYRIFIEELGGTGDMVDHDQRLEMDRFDPFSDQLVLVDCNRSDENLDHVIGVYRLMTAEQAAAAGQFYGEAEYDLTPLKNSGRRLLELGRSCLAPEHRGGTAMFQLWQGLAKYVSDREIEILFGVASFHGTDVDALANSLANLHHTHLAPEGLRPRSRNYQRMDLIAADDIDRRAAMKATPALIKAYLRLGGMIGDGAFVDHAFNTVDVCLVMDTEQMSEKHRDLYTRARVL